MPETNANPPAPAFTADAWPIATCLHAFATVGRDGTALHDADPSVWDRMFEDIERVGFTLAEAVTHPERFLGVHFSNPAPFIPGVELIPHAGTDESAVAMAEAIVAATGKETARVTDSTGFVLNRLQYALFHEATQIVEEGIASPEDIDTIVRTTFGFRLPVFGPFAIADMAGLDVYAFCYASLQTRWPERFATPASLQAHIDAGAFGTKTGAGYLDVPAERTEALVAYRNKAYVAIKRLMDELGPAPIG